MLPMSVPEPVMSLAIMPKSRDATANFSKALNRFTKEDPTFKVTPILIVFRLLHSSFLLLKASAGNGKADFTSIGEFFSEFQWAVSFTWQNNILWAKWTNQQGLQHRSCPKCKPGQQLATKSIIAIESCSSDIKSLLHDSRHHRISMTVICCHMYCAAQLKCMNLRF